MKTRLKHAGCRMALVMAAVLAFASQQPLIAAEEIVLAADVNTAPSQSGDPGTPLVVNDVAFFPATDAEHGAELWRSDGTEAGTWLVRDITPGRLGGQITWLGALGNVALFSYRPLLDSGYAAGPSMLWRTDGTMAGTFEIGAALTGGLNHDFDSLVMLGGAAYFRAALNETGTLYNGSSRLCRTDGTAAGTVVLNDFEPDHKALYDLVAHGGSLFFRGWSADGYELWKSDGTAAGTAQVQNLAGAKNGALALTAKLDALYFLAETAAGGLELWRSDGTAGGSAALATLHPGPDGSTDAVGFGFLGVAGSKLFFRARTAAAGEEMWATNGTPAGTGMFIEFISGSSGGSPGPFFDVDGSSAFFYARDAAHGMELWKTDGTLAGTALVKDINPGTGSSTGSSTMVSIWPVPAFTKLGGIWFFSAFTDAEGVELWKTDGTEAGTMLVKDIYPGPEVVSGVDINTSYSGSGEPSAITALSGRVIFAARRDPHGGQTIGAPVMNRELWVSDGTAAGTVRLRDADDLNLHDDGACLTKLGGGVVFGGRAVPEHHGIELWKSDGSDAGTVQVNEINTGTGSSFPEQLVSTPGGLLGIATSAEHARLFRFDAGAVMLTEFSGAGTIDIGAGMSLHVSNDALPVRPFGAGVGFAKTPPYPQPSAFWTSDGTVAGTGSAFSFADVPSLSSANFHESSPVIAWNGLYFGTTVPSNASTRLWRSDGTAAGTFSLGTMIPDSFLPAFGRLYFTASVAATGSELWSTDGTIGGTALVKDIVPGASGSGALVLGTLGNAFDGVVIFAAQTSASGMELWKTDGTAAGTGQIIDLQPGAGSGVSRHDFTPGVPLPVLGGFAFFPGNNGTTGTELWKTDGTAAGTSLVASFSSGTSSTRLDRFIVFQNQIFFRATPAGGQAGLWRSDGTTAGTVLVKSFADYSNSSPVYPVSDSRGLMDGPAITHNGALYFSGYDAADGWELWRSDGTTAGTAMVRDLFAGSGSSWPKNFVEHQGALYFSAADLAHGNELFRLNTPPVLGGIDLLRRGSWQSSTTISYEQLRAAAQVTDAEGDAVRFRIGSVQNGTLLLNGIPVTPGQVVVGAGDVLTFTPYTLSAAAMNAFEVTADDGSPSQASALVRVQFRSTHDDWREAHFTTGELADFDTSGPLGDADHDGLCNALEFALGLDPKAADSGGAVIGFTGGVLVPLMPQIRFSRAESIQPDTAIFVERASSLAGPWQVIASKTGAAWWAGGALALEENAVGGRVLVSIFAGPPLINVEPCFLRLRVVLY